MVELATAWITIVPETSQIPRQINAALGQADRQAAAAGKSMGGKMSSALGAALKTGGVAAAAAGTAAIGTAMVAGFKRLDAIDQAKGKLSALGASTQTTAKVMDSALASVKGTAYGLGDAATISASAMAAGVKPGADLTKYLTMTADASAIAGSSLSDMGAIMNQVQTGQMAYTDDLNQLADRGIPIYQWLGQEAGKSGAEIKKMASKGQISSEMFFAAIQKNVGGAAKTIGSSTVKGGFENLKAALGRLGAAAEGPGFARLPGMFTSLTGSIDDLTPKAKELATAFDAKVFDEWAPKIKEAFAQFQKTGEIDHVRTVFNGLFEALKGIAPSIGQIATSLGQASAALGVSGWQLFMTALETGSAALSALNPLLQTTANLMRDNQGVVTALAAAWLAFKTVPNLMSRVVSSVSPLATHATDAATSMRSLTSAQGALIQAGTYGTTTMGRFGSSIAQIGQNAPVVARMQQSFVNAAAGASTFGRTAGVAAAAGTGLRSAGSGIASLFGGPLGASLAVGGGAIALVTSELAEARTNAEAYRTATNELAEAHKSLGAELLKTRGNVNDTVISAQVNVLDDYRAKLKAAESQHQSFTERFFANNLGGDQQDRLNEAATHATEARRAIDNLGMTSEQVSKQITGSEGAYQSLRDRLTGMGSDGQRAAQGLDTLRQKFVEQQNVARRVSPGVSELGDAIRVLGDKSASSSDKLNALKTAMDAMNPARNKTEAMAQYGDSIRSAAEAAQGISKDAFNNGQIDAFTESGQMLADTLKDMAEKSAQVASTNGDMNKVNQENEKQFAALAQAAGVSIDQIKAKYQELGGDVVDIAVKLKGDTEVTQKLGLVQVAIKNTVAGEPTVVMKTDIAGAENALKQLGFQLTNLPDGTVQVSATGDAQVKLDRIISAMSQLPPGKAVDVSAPGGSEVRDLLSDLGVKVNSHNQKNVEVTSPLAPGVRDLLKSIGLEVDTRNDKQIIVTANDSDYQNKKTDWLANARKNIEVYATVTGSGASVLDNPEFGRGLGVLKRANGGITTYLNGGISAAEAYANGGARLPNHALIQKANPGGGLVQWAEPETGGEAFIPLAPGKRTRSASILQAVAQMFGYNLVNSAAPEGVSGWLGALTSTAVKGLTTGADGVRKSADGGIVSGDRLRALAEGKGASQPLTGAPYVSGGVNWGDCSGAMSAFARLAAGLDPFGGRFATANEGDYLLKLGAKMGRGTAGTMRFGWLNGGPGGGHTAGTLPDGSNVEMGGGNGGGKLGGSVGADDPQFTDHAYMLVKDSNKYSGGPNDEEQDTPGSGSSLPDSGVGSGYSFDPITSDTNDSGDKSLSGRLGGVASSFVMGQVGSLFDLLSVNNNPGWLAAITEYEKAHKEDARKNYEAEKKKLDQDYKDAEDQRKSEFDEAKQSIDSDYQSSIISADERDRRMLALRNQYDQDGVAKRHDYENAVISKGKQYGLVDNDSVSSLSAKQKYENDQLKSTQQLQSDEFARESQYNRDKLALDNLKQSHAISQDDYDRRLKAAKTRYDNDIKGMKDSYSTSQSELKTNFDRSQTQYAPSDRYLPTNTGPSRFHPTDPGTIKPGKYEDLNTAKSTKYSGPGGVKDAVKAAFADRKWNAGDEWSATDYIVDHESGWNPTAVNPSSGAFGLFQFLGSTQQQYLPDRNPDPSVQGQAGKRYIGDRYGDPLHAKSFWEANHWYDQGGQANGIGVMQKNTLKPERVLSPRQTESFNVGMRNGFGGKSADAIVAKLDQLIQVVQSTPRSQVNYNLPADRSVERVQKIENQRHRAALAGR